VIFATTEGFNAGFVAGLLVLTAAQWALDALLRLTRRVKTARAGRTRTRGTN
jgi:hypothetical protein